MKAWWSKHSLKLLYGQFSIKEILWLCIYIYVSFVIYWLSSFIAYLLLCIIVDVYFNHASFNCSVGNIHNTFNSYSIKLWSWKYHFSNTVCSKRPPNLSYNFALQLISCDECYKKCKSLKKLLIFEDNSKYNLRCWNHQSVSLNCKFYVSVCIFF